MKTCNCEYFCNYRCLCNIGYACDYEGYCDYQTPRDSRPIQSLSPVCTCGQTSSIPCPIHGIGH